VVCSYLNNLEQGETETAPAIRELISLAQSLANLLMSLDATVMLALGGEDIHGWRCCRIHPTRPCSPELVSVQV
jgi:hypothetical protein